VCSSDLAEKSGTFTNRKRRVQQIHRALEPPEGQPSDGEIFTRILAQLVEGEWSFDPASVFAEIAREHAPFAKLSYSAIGLHGRELAA
jgi:predicted molibdopterin-dependent oxidoreductase YjgC